MKNSLTELKKRLLEISRLVSILNLLNWDMEVYMPPQGSDGRASEIAHLSGIIHSKIISLNKDKLLHKLKKAVNTKKLKGDDAVIVLETWRMFERENKLPEQFVKDMAETNSKAQRVWSEARKKNDFKLFLPWLAKIVELKRKEAEYIGYLKSPYDALLDRYEPGMNSERVSQILGDLKDFLLPFIKKIKASPIKINTKKLIGNFPLLEQVEFNKMLLRTIGFNLEAGRVDTSVHPFSLGLHPHDARITTRYDESNLFYSLSSLIHEAGHALYEQGLPFEHFGTPLAQSVSLGIHESQSRMWEHFIGNSLSFWKYFYPKLQKQFPVPFKSMSLKEFYRTVNKITPSLIRTESDEVTYNLHIIIRYEIERGMIEGTIDLKDIPKIWKAKMKEYLGVDVPNDSMGALQDVHWSGGDIGYFPTYTLGNLYAAQFFATMKNDIPDMDKKIAKGSFKEINTWLRKHIHSHGKRYKAEDLVKRVTGEEITSSYFIKYLEYKYKDIYSF